MQEVGLLGGGPFISSHCCCCCCPGVAMSLKVPTLDFDENCLASLPIILLKAIRVLFCFFPGFSRKIMSFVIYFFIQLVAGFL